MTLCALIVLRPQVIQFSSACCRTGRKKGRVRFTSGSIRTGKRQKKKTHRYLRGMAVICHQDIHPGYFVVGKATQLHLLELDLILKLSRLS